jgi:hypothetical protein
MWKQSHDGRQWKSVLLRFRNQPTKRGTRALARTPPRLAPRFGLHHHSLRRNASQIPILHKTTSVSPSNGFLTSIYPPQIYFNSANVKLFTTFALIVLAYTSMSFLSRLARTFSMSSSPAQPMSAPEGAQKATIAAGCFWGVEHMYRRTFANKGLLDARVGYIGGDTKNPSYRSVCSGRSGRE